MTYHDTHDPNLHPDSGYPSILAQILIGAGILAFALAVFCLALLALSLAAL